MIQSLKCPGGSGGKPPKSGGGGNPGPSGGVGLSRHDLEKKRPETGGIGIRGAR